jgi:hypothetical protein
MGKIYAKIKAKRKTLATVAPSLAFSFILPRCRLPGYPQIQRHPAEQDQRIVPGFLLIVKSYKK